MPHSPENLLQLLQRLLKQSNRVKQIHSILITNNHLAFNPSTSSKLKWMSTLLYNALIRAYLSLGQPHTTLVLFTYMLAHQTPPNNLTFSPLVKAASSLPFLAKPLHTHVIKRGVYDDPYILTSFVCVYSQLGDLLYARKVFDEVSERCVVSCNAMLDAYGKNGDMGSAIFLFGRMLERDIYSWTSIISGYGRNGCFREAIQFFRMMIVHEDVMQGRVRPSEATFVSVLTSCANLHGRGGLCQGKQIHAYIVKNESELSVFLGTALIALYGKLGCLGYATEVFNKMVVKEVCAWNALISALALNGEEKEALDIFEKMKVAGLRPNGVTFVSVLASCARSKLVELGLELFQSMSHVFGVVPRMEHYGCVVDLLGRAGLLAEANEFIKKMPLEPDGSVLGALLGACKVHGAIELGNEVSRRLLHMQPRHCGQYVLLWGIYAGAERWDHATALRKTMIDAGIKKIPAYSTNDSM
ncbi:hypothetical protein RJ639_028693 [Escallonia herrerae]|uniref:Pentatricopeptide repeat-containing protein n=1 Tax=Escallonia herrerae TaxID=1293975 RepID=A0AA88X8H4_9ASTE|nr:hypothetical protein RJ639_028693 [Escallonia herrerae]